MRCGNVSSSPVTTRIASAGSAPGNDPTPVADPDGHGSGFDTESEPSKRRRHAALGRSPGNPKGGHFGTPPWAEFARYRGKRRRQRFSPVPLPASFHVLLMPTLTRPT